MSRKIEIGIIVVLILGIIAVFAFALSDTNARADAAQAEAEDLRAQIAEANEQKEAAQQALAEAERQKVVVTEGAESTTSQEKQEEQSTAPVVQAATRQDVVPTDAEIVKADELLGMTSLGSFTVTHYCTCAKCCGKSNGITASGRAAVPHYSIAVDPKVIPLGTVVWLDYGDGVLPS